MCLSFFAFTDTETLTKLTQQIQINHQSYIPSTSSEMRASPTSPLLGLITLSTYSLW